MFSFVFPMDADRLPQFKVTKQLYDAMSQEKEFVIPTRSEFKVARYLDDNDLIKDVRLIPYQTKEGFNASKAFNIGVRAAKYNQIIITSPEVMPKTNVLSQLEELIGQNVICQVWDEDENNKIWMSLVHSGFRDQSPAYYFLAMFNKTDIEKINGWDEDFMKGYAYEDDDFGARWMRAALPFIVRDDIEAIHQYHPRHETIPNGFSINQRKLEKNNTNNVVRCVNGLIKLDI